MEKKKKKKKKKEEEETQNQINEIFDELIRDTIVKSQYIPSIKRRSSVPPVLFFWRLIFRNGPTIFISHFGAFDVRYVLGFYLFLVDYLGS